MRYENTHASHVYQVLHGHLSLTPFPSSIRRFKIKNIVIWRTITLLDIWVIWKANVILFFTMFTYIYALCLLTSECYMFTHYLVNMMIYKVRMMFCGKCKRP